MNAWRTVLLACLGTALMLPALSETANANGRLPDGTSANSHDADFILFPSTFGLLTSSDDGGSFQWICEVNIGYGGTYDPDYAVGADGEIWATTFDGLRQSQDAGCNWQTIGGIMADRFFSDVEVGTNGRVWAASATGGAANDVFVSDDGGATFQSAGLEDPKIWWRSIRISPSSPDILYVSGFLAPEADGQGGMTPAEAHLRKSIDGGASWTVLPVTDFAFGQAPNLFIEQVSPNDPDILFARVLGAHDPIGDDIYRSADGGATWTLALEFQDFVRAFAILADGTTVIAGSRANCPGDAPDDMKGCVQRSTDLGLNWAPATDQPKMGCLHQRSNGELIACGANWAPDNFALGRSSDGGETWEKVVRFSEISGPLSCPASDPQSECAAKDWPGLCVQLGICDAPDAGATGDDAGPGGDDGDGDGGGCLGCSSTSAPLAVGFAFIALLPLGWRRRRRD